MHAGTAGDPANRTVAKQLLGLTDWAELASPLIRVIQSTVLGDTNSKSSATGMHAAMFTIALCNDRYIATSAHTVTGNVKFCIACMRRVTGVATLPATRVVHGGLKQLLQAGSYLSASICHRLTYLLYAHRETQDLLMQAETRAKPQMTNCACWQWSAWLSSSSWERPYTALLAFC